MEGTQLDQAQQGQPETGCHVQVSMGQRRPACPPVCQSRHLTPFRSSPRPSCHTTTPKASGQRARRGRDRPQDFPPAKEATAVHWHGDRTHVGCACVCPSATCQWQAATAVSGGTAVRRAACPLAIPGCPLPLATAPSVHVICFHPVLD